MAAARPACLAIWLPPSTITFHRPTGWPANWFTGEATTTGEGFSWPMGMATTLPGSGWPTHAQGTLGPGPESSSSTFQ